MGGGADDPSYSSFGSRWGIKGSSEVSEGLTSVYKFETRIGQGDASQDTNQLYAGLSGGFGNVTLGKQVGATYNHSGAIRDISNWHSGGDVGSRISNALSYSYAAESFSMQVAAIMDGEKDTDGAVDRVEFGMTVGLGDLGKVAIGYEKTEDAITDKDMKGNAIVVAANGALARAEGSTKVTGQDKIVWRHGSTGTGDVAMVRGVKMKSNVMVVDVVQTKDEDAPIMEDADGRLHTSTCATRSDGDSCVTQEVLVTVSTTAVSGEDLTNPEANTKKAYARVGASPMAGDIYEATGIRTVYGHKASHISASFGLAGITVALGHTTKDSNSPMMNDKMKTNFLGASGSIGDTGLSWNAWGRNVKNNEHVNGDDRSPWTVGLAKSLGGGATTFIEHNNKDNGKDGTTSVALRVDF